MRKSLSILMLVALVAMAFSSCKPREKCPAYGQAAVSKAQKAS